MSLSFRHLRALFFSHPIVCIVSPNKPDSFDSITDSILCILKEKLNPFDATNLYNLFYSLVTYFYNCSVVHFHRCPYPHSIAYTFSRSSKCWYFSPFISFTMWTKNIWLIGIECFLYKFYYYFLHAIFFFRGYFAYRYSMYAVRCTHMHIATACN